MRPALMVAEREPENALTIRKLILETAKYNVLTAHTAQEALELIETFPRVSAAVIASNLGPEDDCSIVAKAVKKTNSKIPVIYLSPTGMMDCEFADHSLSTYEPEQLLTLVRELLGDPVDSSFGTKTPNSKTAD